MKVAEIKLIGAEWSVSQVCWPDSSELLLSSCLYSNLMSNALYGFIQNLQYGY